MKKPEARNLTFYILFLGFSAMMFSGTCAESVPPPADIDGIPDFCTNFLNQNGVFLPNGEDKGGAKMLKIPGDEMMFYILGASSGASNICTVDSLKRNVTVDPRIFGVGCKEYLMRLKEGWRKDCFKNQIHHFVEDRDTLNTEAFGEEWNLYVKDVNNLDGYKSACVIFLIKIFKFDEMVKCGFGFTFIDENGHIQPCLYLLIQKIFVDRFREIFKFNLPG